MVTKSLDPDTPEQPGEPNSEVEPGRPIDEIETPPPPQEEPARPSESGDYISEIRQSLVTEESSRSKRSTGSLIRRITGSLRRVTGPLRHTGDLPDEKKESVAAPEPAKPGLFEDISTAGPESGAAAESMPVEEITDELLAGRLTGTPEEEVSDDFLTNRLDNEPARTYPDNLHTRPLDSDLAPEISDDFLTSRFGTAAEEEAPSISREELWGDLPDSGSEAEELLRMEEGPSLPDDSPITLLESGAIAAMGAAEDELAQGDEQDWMREIRAEAQDITPGSGLEAGPTGAADFEARPDLPASERSTLRGATGKLQNFIANILGRSSEKQSQLEETVLPDELFSDRLERSLGGETGERPAAGAETGDAFLPSGEGLLDEPFPLAFHEAPIIDETSILDTPFSQDKPAYFEGLEVDFADVGVNEPSDEISGYELYPEDEALLWGTAEHNDAEAPAPDIPITPEDIWGTASENDPNGYGSDLRREIWGDAVEPDTPGHDYFSPLEISNPEEDDTFAATYLTGTDFLPPMVDERDRVKGTGNLLSEVLEETPQPEEEETASVQDLRSVALEDYEEGGEFDYSDYTYKIDWGDEDQVTTVETETETEAVNREQAEVWAEEADADARESLSIDWKSWFANRKTFQKVLLVEAAVAVVAMLIALPYFLFVILRGPLVPTAQTQPGALPAGVPYPTGLTLPGGWYFPLEKSTLANGKWQPSTSEWLEGSELRRVVAIPWNAQTEAVIKTFQTGDRVELYLSNNETLKYRVSSIEQMEVSNTQVYSDRNPSLAIILYQPKDPTRWVIICKP